LQSHESELFYFQQIQFAEFIKNPTTPLLHKLHPTPHPDMHPMLTLSQRLSCGTLLIKPSEFTLMVAPGFLAILPTSRAQQPKWQPKNKLKQSAS